MDVFSIRGRFLATACCATQPVPVAWAGPFGVVASGTSICTHHCSHAHSHIGSYLAHSHIDSLLEFIGEDEKDKKEWGQKKKRKTEWQEKPDWSKNHDHDHDNDNDDREITHTSTRKGWEKTVNIKWKWVGGEK